MEVVVHLTRDVPELAKVPILLVCLLAIATAAGSGFQASKKVLVAHRGASAYAPEHTLDAYRLAIEQGADFVEQDLQISRDGVLVCLHDLTLERTTDVETVFPTRGQGDGASRHWRVSDFTLAELKQLDAGSWFSEKFRGARIPTFQEAIDTVRGKAGLYPETKTPEAYDKSGLEMERLLIETLKKNKLDQPDSDVKTPIIIQSFSAASLRRLAALGSRIPRVFLVSSDPGGRLMSGDGLKEIAKYASGIGPAKRLIEADPELVKRAHTLKLTVTPYTFRSAATGSYPSVREEMKQFLYIFDVDALFTDNPDQFPRGR